MKLHLASFLTVFFAIGCEITKFEDNSDNAQKQQASKKQDKISKYCEAYPRNKQIDWDYFKAIDVKDLLPVSTNEYLAFTGEEKTLGDGNVYIKARSKPDGDCFIRNGNFLVFERIISLQDTTHRSQTLENFKQALSDIWPYRKKSLKDPGQEKIVELVEFLFNSSNTKELLQRLNHPYVDTVLNWLMRDLSWAYDNRRLMESINDLKTSNSSLDLSDDEITEIIKQLPENDSDRIEDIANKHFYRKVQNNYVLNKRYATHDHDYAGNPYSTGQMWYELYHEKIFDFKIKDSNKECLRYADIWISGKSESSKSYVDINFLKEKHKRVFLMESSRIHADVLILKSLTTDKN